MAVDKSKDTKILNVLHSTVAGSNKLAHADEIYDEEWSGGEKNQHDINAELKTAIDTAGSTSTDAIKAESDRAKAAEQKLTEDLAAEVTRAKAAEKTNADAVTAEATRAQAAEKANADAIVALDTVTAKRTGGKLVWTEGVNYVGANPSLRGGIETLDGKVKENADAIAKETADRKAADKVNSDAIAKEVTDRTNADNALQTALDTEKTDRANADRTLQTNIDNEAAARKAADDALSARIDNINAAYQYVASVNTLDDVKNYTMGDTGKAVRNGSVFNVVGKFVIGGKTYDAGTNVAINKDFAKGTAITEDAIDPLGGSFDTSALDADIAALRQVVYTNHAWVNVSVSPAAGYKGENTDVTLTYSAGINGSTGLTPTFAVKKNGTAATLASGVKETLNADTTYEVTATLGGVSKQGSAKFSTFYPVYTFTAKTARVDAIPEGAIKQAVTSTPSGKTYAYAGVADGSFLYIAVPAGMTVNGGTSGGYDAGFLEQDAKDNVKTIAVDGKGTYSVYRTNLAQSAGDYSILFK